MISEDYFVQVEDDCKLSSVDELAAAVYEMLGRIQDEDSLNWKSNSPSSFAINEALYL